jgi:hypothetical protein
MKQDWQSFPKIVVITGLSRVSTFQLNQSDSVLWKGSDIRRCSICGLFRVFWRYSQSSKGSGFRFCGGAVAMVSTHKKFNDDVTVM